MRRREFITLLGAAASLPLAARAQQKAMPVIGYFHFATPEYTPMAASFLQGLKEAGYVAGQNVAIEYRWAEGQYDRLPAMAAELVGRKVDLIAAFGPPLARAAKNATATIPIVFEVGNDAVAAGLVASLARPGGNATGLSILFTQLTPKRLELLCELVPQARTIALLVNPNSPTAEPSIQGTQEAARAKGVQLSVLNASTDGQIDAAFATFATTPADGLVIAADPFFDTRRERLIGPAARSRMPTIYFSRESVAAGGLISYGSSLGDVYRQMGIYAARILKGEKPADLPVEQPTKFEMAINLKTANALGLRVPPKLIFTADEVIE
ncbi:MAG TPA: ABC transporter substrate-binding protein [Bradyrhizobium sp.]|jgi:putative ABC transport system substrate-binding protein|uniref:ABC transporter substrate-binding protein n=1 Tax=Bradyrhizobium sp. TaxID=376 RepID=UPI002BAAE3A5|nr:ABC transporter substrate-binding protein [Bradyrhizobium sp.]HTB02530.1 ABC transporter substrate-binding protein [Bradyrhizobium sp.]